jgi:hypothetical protein
MTIPHKARCETKAAHGGKVTSYGLDIRDAAVVDAMVD